MHHFFLACQNNHNGGGVGVAEFVLSCFFGLGLGLLAGCDVKRLENRGVAPKYQAICPDV